jgi:hypothetical protein
MPSGVCTVASRSLLPRAHHIAEQPHGSLLTRRWREMDSNPRSPVRMMYANTEIGADRQQRGRRSAGKPREQFNDSAPHRRGRTGYRSSIMCRTAR